MKKLMGKKKAFTTKKSPPGARKNHQSEGKRKLFAQEKAHAMGEKEKALPIGKTFKWKMFIKNRTEGDETKLKRSYEQWCSSPRPISIGQLNTLLHLHLRPIKLVVYKRPYPFGGISYLEACFTLRCFQRLSLPYAATQLCPWQNNWCTGGTSDPVLSY